MATESRRGVRHFLPQPHSFLNDLGLKSLDQLPPLQGEEPKVEEFELDFSDKNKKADEQKTPELPLAEEKPLLADEGKKDA